MCQNLWTMLVLGGKKLIFQFLFSLFSGIAVVDAGVAASLDRRILSKSEFSAKVPKGLLRCPQNDQESMSRVSVLGERLTSDPV